MKKIKMNVTGMTCGHCVVSVNNAVNKVRGVIEVDTSLSKGETTILALEDINIEDIKKNIENAGYTPLI
jgi:copper chaperone CopZ